MLTLTRSKGWWLDMKIIYEHFDSLGQYLDTIQVRKVNRVFSGHSLHSEDRDYSFTLTESYEEANELARTGYKEGLDKLKAANSKARHTGSAQKALPVTSVVGFAPHVPNAITGVPCSMITTQKVEQKAKVISILYYMGGACHVNAKEFVEAGKNILNVIYTLELQGYRVALNVLTNFCESDERALCSVQIKHWRQPSNPLKISYPLIHPSFFRRHGFRWLETQPELTVRDFTCGYGRPLDNTEGRSVNDRRRWLKEQGILQDGWFYTERLEAKAHEADELIKLMGITDKAGAKAPSKSKRSEPAKALGYKPSGKYELERGAGLRFDKMELPQPFEIPEDDLPDFSPADLRLPPEALYKKLMAGRKY